MTEVVGTAGINVGDIVKLVKDDLVNPRAWVVVERAWVEPPNGSVLMKNQHLGQMYIRNGLDAWMFYADLFGPGIHPRTVTKERVREAMSDGFVVIRNGWDND